MSYGAYSEDQLVEQPAIGLFAALDWQTVSALEETFGAGGTLGRETKGEAVLVERLRAALVRFNPTLPPEAISNAVDELSRDRSAMSLEAANHEVYRLLKEGITVSVPNLGSDAREHGGQKTERLRVVDWEQPANNDFLLVSQFSVTGALYTCRPDLVGFVNGLPWVVIELKKPGVPARAAFDENLTHYKQAADSSAVLEQRAAHRQQWHRQPRWLAHRRLGALGRVEAHRARGRTTPRVAGGDAARHL